MKRRIDKLRESAAVRFGTDQKLIDWYLALHLSASVRHDAQHYWISTEAFDQVKRKVVGRFGERRRLTKPSRPLRPKRNAPCVHLGDPTGETVECKSCKGVVWLKVFACAVHGECFVGKSADARPSCRCAEYQP